MCIRDRLWINLLTDAAPALAMGVDPQTDDVMGRKPRKVTDRVIDASMWGDIISVSYTHLDVYKRPGRHLPSGGVH